MATTSIADLGAPTPTRMPAAPSNDFMTQPQWDTLYALLDGVLPAIKAKSACPSGSDRDSLVVSDEEYKKVVDEAIRTAKSVPDGASPEKISEFMAYRAIEYPAFREDCLRALYNVPPSARGQLVQTLQLLTGHIGSMLLTGYWTPVARQPTQVRHAILKNWAGSRLPPLRLLAKSIAAMGQKGNGIANPYFSELSGYTDYPRDWKPVEGYDFDFVQVPAGSGVHELSTDVLIVGSGCGGGVCAKNTAEAGHQVLVVDKGYHFPPSTLPLTQAAASHYLYDAGGFAFSDSNGIGVLSGNCWGGGGTVNWSVCFRTQDYVREEWAAQGLPLFTSPDYDECMDRVWHTIGASKDAIRHNYRNNALINSAAKLGWKSGVVEQNTASKEHYCGRCHLGCGSGEKQGPATSWLPAAGRAGAKFMEGFQVERVLFAGDGVTAVGVEGLWTSRDDQGNLDGPLEARTQRRVVIKAKKVIISGGTIWSPVILAKSGVKNPQVGRNLYLHPVNLVTGVYDEDLQSWEGGIITSYIDEFENLDGKGHGVKLEPTCNLPYTTFGVNPWTDGLDAKVLALKFRHLATFISLTRDRDTGRVFPDPKTGKPRIDYDASDFDREHTMEGVVALAKIFYVSGAKEIRAHLPGSTAWVPKDNGAKQASLPAGKDPEFTDDDFAAWLKSIRKVSNRPPFAPWASAHQMGTCRMSAREDKGVVDMHGKVWGKKNLYVADASVFPSASGVNPMVTTMSIADWISRGVAAELAA